MEISGNKYLHKKFKKQTNCSPVYNIEDKSDNGNDVLPANNGEGSNANEEEATSFPFLKDNKPVGNVPNFKSTNCAGSLVDVNVNVNVKLDNQSSISTNVDVSVNSRKSSCSAYPAAAKPSSLTSRISNINITTTASTISMLGNENSVRNLNFDTKVSEPNIASIEKSSILDTVYSKPSLISERSDSTTVPPADELTSSRTGDNQEKRLPGCVAETGGGKYVCTYCNLACSKPSVLQKHIRAHTNERPYPCTSCGFSFKTRSNLYKHCRSRSHANRVMGNKHIQTTAAQTVEMLDITDTETDKFLDDKQVTSLIDESYTEENSDKFVKSSTEIKSGIMSLEYQKNTVIKEQKSKPYKPRFHTAKIFFEESRQKENNIKNLEAFTPLPHISPVLAEPQVIKNNPDLLKLRINELINKNNSIMNCDEAIVIRRKNMENLIENDYLPTHHVQWQSTEEPLNLTAKNRKRCLSDSDNNHKSLIKELLLKNLSTDPNLQCPYCKMIFQTVTELEMHKLKYCHAKSSNIRYARSSSVNVASILTQNKNAFDNIPHMQHTTFPLKSPGPFLGNTRLIENDKPSEKYRTFSFDDNVIMHHSQSDSPSYNKYLLHPVGTYPLSPQIKKNPIKLFGGEVKITQTSGETRSFKIESESINKMEDSHNFMEFNSGNLSENLVIKSTLQSGGTVLQNKANYSPKMDNLPSSNIIRVYENSDIVPTNLNLPILNEKSKFYDKISLPVRQNDKLLIVTSTEMAKRKFSGRDKIDSHDNVRTSGTDIKLDSDKDKELYKSNLMDFSQKAVKLLTPNLKPPNLTIPGIPIPSAPSDRIIHSPAVTIAPLEINTDSNFDAEILNFAKKQISMQQRMAEVSQPQTVYNPVNIVVNGKVIRYVPGIPGPITAEIPPEMPMHSPNANRYLQIPTSKISNKENPKSPRNEKEKETPTIIIDQPEPKSHDSKIIKGNEKILDSPNANIQNLEKTLKEESRKFVRPTSLALKPNSVALKSHHGLTPTMFNQALISPDTPRVAKKYCQQYLNGNYFSYLGLKSSTKSVYCTLNKTQPFYVKHFKKLSMYSEWRQQESKINSLSVSAYDSRQRQQKYTQAGHAQADLIVHSSYKFIKTDNATKEENLNKNQSVLGGYESNEDYTYIRGRGRGRYVCDQCGIRCKKPSMLKKHIRTHSDDRPYTCEHCNFSFKTKGNLTKHMKSKAHSKKYAATSNTSTQNSVTTSSESDESDAESSDESTRLQEHEAAHCLLSLAQKNNQNVSNQSQELNSPSYSTTAVSLNLTEFPNFLKDDKFLKNPDQINQVTNTNFAKNKIMYETNVNFVTTKHLTEVLEVETTKTVIIAATSQESENVLQYLGKSSTLRPLTYPYLQTQFDLDKNESRAKNSESPERIPKISNKSFNQTQEGHLHKSIIKTVENKFNIVDMKMKKVDGMMNVNRQTDFTPCTVQNVEGNLPANIVFRKRKLSTSSISSSSSVHYKVQRSDVTTESSTAVDLSIPQDASILDLSPAAPNGELISFNGAFVSSNVNSLNKKQTVNHDNQSDSQITYHDRVAEPIIVYNQTQKPRHNSFSESNSSETLSQSSDTTDRVLAKIIEVSENSMEKSGEVYKTNLQQDQSAMQTLAEIAIKQVKLESNILAKSVASEYLKLALNNESSNVDGSIKKFTSNPKEPVNELIVKPEESKNCSICSKNFSKPSQLRLHMNIHYLERPFRCESCSVSFRTRGHLQKHERSASHHNKLSSSPALSSLEPRPFKCTDCNIAFRIHGHLAKHLRSKLHIMKLECLAKIPFGLYAELERANSLLTEINTTDGELCLESLKILARKLFSNDPSKLEQLSSNASESRDS